MSGAAQTPLVCCPDILLGPVMQVLAPTVRNMIQRVSGQHLSLLRKKKIGPMADKEKRKQVVILILLAIKMCC